MTRASCAGRGNKVQPFGRIYNQVRDATGEVILNFSVVLHRLATWFEAERIPFAVTGGLALQAFGYARFTADVDLVIPRAFQEPVIERMQSDGYETLYRSEGYSNHVHTDAQLGRVDFIWVDESTAGKIFTSTRQVTLVDLELPIPRPEYLVAMKLQAIRNDPGRRLRDLADIQHLVRLPGIDLEEVRDYFRRFDLLKDYDEVKP